MSYIYLASFIAMVVFTVESLVRMKQDIQIIKKSLLQT